jgi:regulator of cell morphogenesis and NO signaling
MPTGTQSIREIISSQPTAAAILRRFDIDVCAHAGDSLNQACAGLQLSVEQVLEKLEDAAIEAGAAHSDPMELSLSRLIQHIVRLHHQDIRQDLPRLVELVHAVAEKHAKRAPGLGEVEKLIAELHVDLSEHIGKEEQVLFPYIAQLHDEPPMAFRPPQAGFSRVGQPVFIMVQEHEREKLIVAKLRQLTDDLKPPVWACSAFVALYSGLRAFAERFQEHIRLENDVLFPRAMHMEETLVQAGAR